MSNNKSTINSDNQKILLDLLSAVDSNNNITQRSMASKLGIALGLTNTYLNRCVDKGLIKIRHVPRNRYAYYLTPRGFMEKARMTQNYFKSSFQFFRKTKQEFEELFIKLEKLEHNNIILSDITDVAEIAILSSLGMKLNIIGVIGNSNKDNLAGVKIYKNLQDINTFNFIIVTADKDTNKRYDNLTKLHNKNIIILPKILRNL